MARVSVRAPLHLIYSYLGPILIEPSVYRYGWPIAHAVTLCEITLIMLTPHDTSLFTTPHWQSMQHFFNHYTISAACLTLRSILTMRTATLERKRFSAREELQLRELPIECQFFSELRTADDLWRHLQSRLTASSERNMQLTWMALLTAFSLGGLPANPRIAFGQAGDFIIAALAIVANVGYAHYLAPMFAEMTQHYRQKREMMDILTAVLSPRTAAMRHLPHLCLANRSNAEAWTAMRHGTTTWFLLPDLHRSEGFLGGLFLTEFISVIGILFHVALRWTAHIWFNMIITLALIGFIVAPLYHLLVINTSVRFQVTAIHDTKVQEQLRGDFRDQADRDFLEVSPPQTINCTTAPQVANVTLQSRRISSLSCSTTRSQQRSLV
jgi:hypothetical protein